MARFIKFLNSEYFFIVILILFILLYIFLNFDLNNGDLTSDTWMEQYLMPLRSEPSQISSIYSREKFYLAPYLFYYISPGLKNGVLPYHFLAIVIIALVYTVSGFVIKKIFDSWPLASLAGVALLIPRYVFSTNIGILNFRNLRGLAFAFPFYFLLSYFWTIYGIKNKKQNIFLAALAALLVYLYPPVGIVIVPMFILTALIIYRKKYFKEIAVFAVIYLILSSFFWCNYFSNPNPSSLALLGKTLSLNGTELKMQAEILRYRIPDIYVTGVDFGTLKRSVWDGIPLLAAFLLSFYLVKKNRDRLKETHLIFFKIGTIFSAIVILFAISVEIVNGFLYSLGRLPVFMEHLRLLRALGFIWIGQAIFVVFVCYKILGKKSWAAVFSLVLVLSPLSMSASLVRNIVRLVIPSDMRMKYNLAPTVSESDTRSYKNLEESALWAKENLDIEGTKIFVFDDSQNEFKFKVLSKINTNLTGKEGPIYIASGFENSKKWYEERQRYEEVTNAAKNFKEIFNLAEEFYCTHILLPRGKFMDLYYGMERDDKSDILYSNADYKIIKIK